MKKNAIVCNELSSKSVIGNAVRRLSEIILDYTGEYPMCFSGEGNEVPEGARCFHLKKSEELSKAEEYRITVENDTVAIEGSDDNGILYGCIDFYDKYLSSIEWTERSDHYIKNPFEGSLPDFSLTSSPSISQRGLWTWGHVIYDWRGYVDNMMRLKMNTLIMWNEYVPINAVEIIEYAHNAGIKIYFGFPWGWGVDCKKTDMSALDKLSDSVIEYYEKHYASLGCDGIYFQSFTEINEERIAGVLVAEAVTDFVNKTAAKIYEKYPNLDLQFGLHADSVKTRLEFIARTDPRITIVWENCGAFPYNYIPSAVGDFEETDKLTEKICNLRGENEKFGAVLKGLTKLDWGTFEYPKAPYYIGVASEKKVAERIARKRDIWRYLEAHWLANSDYAMRTVQTMVRETDGKCCVTALVEDGMFERRIHYPVALLAEMLWSAETPCRKLVSAVALRDYITFEM